MNIVLIGYRGCGKTTVGKLLAAELNWKYISTDDEIIKKAKSTIPEIVKKYDWEKFRDIETEITKKVAKKDRYIIDTGGGIILREQNILALKRNGKFIWLKAGIKTITKRIKHSKDRPSLIAGKTFLQEISDVLKERIPIYKRVADFIITTDNKTPKEITKEITLIPQIKNLLFF